MGSLTQETQVLQTQASIKLQNLAPVHNRSILTLHNEANVDVELSDGPLQEQASAVGVVPSVWDPYMNRFRFVATCVTTIADALSDGAAGALIPYIEKYVFYQNRTCRTHLHCYPRRPFLAQVS